MEDKLVRNIGAYQANERINLPYPHLFITGSNDALPVVLGALEPGELPIIIRYDGTLMKVGTIKKSALVMAKLLKVFEFTICMSSDVQYSIKNRKDILDCDLWR